MSKMISADDALKNMEPRGFSRLKHIKGCTYKDQSVVMLIPTRGMIHHRVVTAFTRVAGPQNHKRGMLIISGDEVGEAYNRGINAILGCPEQSTYKYLMTIEDDNIVPPDCMLKLLESIEDTGFDAMSGLYFSKGDFGFPMAFGDPEKYRRDGIFEFWPRDVKDAVAQGQVMEVNGIAMGCALWRMELFREFPAPWFKTWHDFGPEGDSYNQETQDLYFCNIIRKAGRRIGVDCRVKVGHLDTRSEIVW